MKKYYIKIGKIVLLMICLSIFLTLIIPIIYNRCSGKAWDNNFTDLWGNCSAGISSALITLASVAITVTETRRIQEENNTDANKKIVAERNERLKKERREVINTISGYIGKYITHSQVYFESALMDYHLKKELEHAEQSLKEYEKKAANLGEDMTLQNCKASKNILEQKANTKDKISRIKEEIYENSKNGKRIIASECYFVLKTQLSTVEEANDLLKKLDDIHSSITKVISSGMVNENWVKEKSDELIDSFNTFKKKYETIPYEDENM